MSKDRWDAFPKSHVEGEAVSPLSFKFALVYPFWEVIGENNLRTI
jgi:hypothetical protein